LGGVYKLVAVLQDGDWDSAIKISDTLAKTPNPGNKKLWRLYDNRNKATADLLALHTEDPRQERILLRHPMDHTKYRIVRQADLSNIEPLQTTVYADGKLAYDPPPLDEIRRQRDMDLERLDPGIRRLVNPHIYHVSLSQQLWDLKQELIEDARSQNLA
jgi:nicotinate phosphoribosyltransferase